MTVKAAHKKITLNGYTRSRTVQTLASEESGKVLSVNYDVGQTIGSEPFLQIDPTFIDFQIEQSRWSLHKLKVANSQAQSQKDFLQKEFHRIDRLRKDNVATLAKWEAAAEELKQAQLALRTSDVEISALSIQIEELQERRKRHHLSAPKGWIVVTRKVEPGEIITAGTPLGQVADFTQMVVPLFVSGPQLAAIKNHTPLMVMVEDQPVTAEINWINPEFDERSRKLAIELVLVDFDGEKRGGLMAQLPLHVPTEGLMVPKASVTNRYDNPHVVSKEAGRSIPVTILDESDDHLIIAEDPTLSVGMTLSIR